MERKLTNETFAAKNYRRSRAGSLLFLLIACLFTLNIYGEGTREFLVNTTPVGTGLQFDTTKSNYTGQTPTTPANVVQVWDQGPSPGGLGRATGTYSSIPAANEKMRIKIRVCKAGEVINLGFNPSNNQLTYWRLYRPNGTAVRFNGAGGSTNLSAIAGVETVSGATYTYRMPTSAEATQPGYIRWYSQAAVGPLPACSTVAAGQLGVGYPARTYCGYAPIQYVVTAADMALAGADGYLDFFIVFNGNHPTNEQKTVNRHLAMFDVTVWDNNTSSPRVVRKGRLYSAAWDINCNGSTNPKFTFNSKLYFYSKDSVITSVTFNQMRPWGFIICANSTGTANTGDTDFDRRSRIQFNGAPDYPVFLNNPYPNLANPSDPNNVCGVTPKESFGDVTDASITGCDNDRCINLQVTKSGVVGITLLPKPGEPPFVPRVFNNMNLPAGINTCIPWDGRDGAGNPIYGPLRVIVNYFNGLTNLPLYDVEDHEFGYLINLEAPVATPGAQPILVFWDDRPPAGTGVTNINAGQAMDGLWDNDNNPLTPDIPVGYHDGDPLNSFVAASTYNLLGCDPSIDHSASTPGIQGCHLWRWRGMNVACPGDPNCAETLNTWWNANVIEREVDYFPSNVQVFSDIEAVPTNPDGTGGNPGARTKNVCYPTGAPIPIHGVVKVDLDLQPPLAQDALDVTDDVDGQGVWSIVTGSGTFGSAPSNLQNTYIPDAGGLDLARGYILLRVTSVATAQTPCGTANDTLRINITQGPVVFVRENITVCANNALVRLNTGIAPNISGGNNRVTSFLWTPLVGGVPLVGGTFVPNNASVGTNATYTPPASFTSGVITMRLSSQAAGALCPAARDSFTITVETVPLVNAVDTLKICRNLTGPTTVPIPANQATINGSASLTGFTVNWTGSGSFTGNGTLTPVYTPTLAELTTGIAKIAFNVTKTSAPSCGPVRDTLIIAFYAPPAANAGPGFSACRNNVATIPLNGTATNYGSVSWASTPATGSFSPTNNPVTIFTPPTTLPASYTFTLTANPVTGSPCAAVTSDVAVTFTDPNTIDIPAATIEYCPENPVVSVTVNSPIPGEWYGDSKKLTKPLGTISPSDQATSITYTLTPPEIGFIIGLFFVADPVGNCLSAVDSVALIVVRNPVVTLPETLEVCRNVNTTNVSATITGPVGTIQWSTLGTGTFSTTSIANTVYTPSADDKSNGSVRLIISVTSPSSCLPVRDTVLIRFTEPPLVEAGSDHHICANNPVVNITGTVIPASASSVWSVVSGPGGSFSNTASPATTFTATSPSAGDTTVIRLQVPSFNGCLPVSDIARIIYTAPPTATVTTVPGTVCANNAVIQVIGSTSTGTGTWTSSSGCNSCFVDANRVGQSPALDSTIYTPSATDIANGSVTFTLQTGNNGNCNAVASSPVTFTITPSPVVSIDSILSVCENNATMTLSAHATPGNAGTWSSSSGCVSCFSLNGPDNLTGTYTPSVSDINNGSVTFTFISANNGNCVAVSTTRTGRIDRAPVVNAGPDLTICSNQNSVALTGGTQSNTAGVLWRVKSGTGTITNANSLTTAVYNITATDKANGTVLITLTGFGNGNCDSVIQERVLFFTDIPVANVGPPQTVCMNDAPATLDGSGSPGGTWTCVGCASSITNPNSLTASYNPALAEVNQTRTFTYSIPASAGCPAVSASTTVTFRPAPEVTITPVGDHCGNTMIINLSGTVANSPGMIWTSSGTGSFSNATTSPTQYTLSAADTVGFNSTVTFNLISTGSAICSPDTATTTVTITDPIILNAGADQNLCGAPGTVITLTPSVLSGGATSVTWTTVGAHTGTLTPGPGAISATYTVGAGDAGTTVTFRATTNAVGVCAARTSEVSYTFIAPAVATISTAPAAFCQTESVVLGGTIANANTGTWACTNCTGAGTFSPDNTYNNLTAQTQVAYTPAPSDTAAVSLNFILITDNVNLCGRDTSAEVTVTLDKKPRVTLPALPPVCANNNVIDLTSIGTVTHSNAGFWHVGATKTTGFAPTNAFPVATSYDPDTIEVQNGFVTLTLIATNTGTCPPDSAKATVVFTESPVISAGMDRTICKNNPTFNLVGSITPSSGFNLNWSSPNCGSTCFSAPNSLTTNYTLSYPADTTGSTLMLFLTATDPTGLCSPERDTVLVHLTQPPTVNITSTFDPICGDSLYLNLSGLSTNGYNWSSNGTGSFQSSPYLQNVTYPLTAADRARANLPSPNNRIRIVLSSNGGFCLPVSDTVEITLTPAPVVTITTGDSMDVCANLNTVDLSASVDQAGFEIDWTTSGSGIFTPDAPASAFTTTYALTTLDKAAGTIVLTANTVNPPGNTCKRAFKQYKVKVIPLPVVEAGAPITVCQTTTAIDLSDASFSHAGSASWSTSGSGVFGIDNTTVGTGSVYYPTYLGTPGTNDVDQPSITLTLTAAGCSTITDTKVINFITRPAADAGAPDTVCFETNSVSLTGVPANASSVNWRVAGSATTFANTPGATYNLTAANKAAGFVDLVFTANGNGSCGPARDTVRIVIRPLPTLEVGPNASFCSQSIAEVLQYNFPPVSVTGSGISPVVSWSTTNMANLDVYNPLAPVYTITNSDITAGSVTIVGTVRSHPSCVAVNDAMTINITRAPRLNIGPDISVCASSDTTLALHASSTYSTGVPSWYTDQAGFFDNPNSYNPVYDPDPTEEIDGQTTEIIAMISGQGSCPPAYDTLYIRYTSIPVLADLLDTVICFTNGVPFTYGVSTGILGDWTTSSGAFLAPGGTGQQAVTLEATAFSNSTITITFDPTSVCYGAQTADATLTLVEAPTISVTSPLDVCLNNYSTPLDLASAPNHAGSVSWSLVQGSGTIGSGSSADATYTVNTNDFALDSILVKVTAYSANPSCPIAEDTVTIYTHQAPTIALADQIVCSDQVGVANAITLEGNINGTGYTGTTWSSGALSAIDNVNAIPTTATLGSFPATVTLTANGLHSSCAAVNASFTINPQAAPVVNITTANIPLCTSTSLINLSGSITIAGASPTDGFWSKVSPTTGGAFTPNAFGSTGVSYIPSAADAAQPNVILRYTITDVGVCTNTYSGDIQLNFSNQKTVAASPSPITFCAQDNAVRLTAYPSPLLGDPLAPVLQWDRATGSGAFTGATNDSIAFYDPSTDDINNGGAIIVVRTTNNTAVGCPEDSALVSLLLVPVPSAIVNAGDSLMSCKDREFMNLQGIIINAEGGRWSLLRPDGFQTSGVEASGTFSDENDLESLYYITSSDTTKQRVRLYLYSVGQNAFCSQVVDSVDIIFHELPVPSITVGAPSVCADVDSINLTGIFTPLGVDGVWSSSGDGYFTNLGAYDPTPIYIPGPSDIAVGKVIYTYTSNSYLDCKAYSTKDSTIITPKIQANAGPDLTVCGNNTTGITLNATLSPTGIIGQWEPIGVHGTDFGGTFNYTPGSLQATYIPADTIDPVMGAVAFRFLSTNGAPCKADTSNMILHIAPAPTVTIASNTQTVCNDVSSINVNVTNITVATQGYWITSGTGNFVNPTALNTQYQFSTADLDSTNITIAFITTGNTSNGSLCNPAADAMVITLKPKPVVTAASQYNCITPIGVTLDNSSVSYVDPGSSGVWTTNSVGIPGQFSLDPYISDATGNATSYFPSTSDIERGTVTLTLTSVGAGTCQPISRSVTLNVSNTPIADAGPDLFVCNNDVVSLKANAQPNLVQYDWESFVPAAPVLTASGLEAQAGPITGPTSFRLTVTDIRGCTNLDTIVVNAVQNPNIQQPEQQCYDYYGYVTTNVTGTTSPLGTYQWYYNNALMSGENRDTVRITQPGVYQVYYSLGACSVPSLGSTMVLDVPRILTPDFIGCNDDSVTATVLEIPNAQLAGFAPPIKPYTYDWTPASSSTTSTARLATPSLNPLVIDTLTYYVTASYTTAPFGLTCTYLDSVRVIGIPVPDPHLVDSAQVCEGQIITLDANTPPSNLPYLSLFNQTIEWYAAGSPTPVLGNQAVFNPQSSGNYVVKVTIDQCTGDDTARVDFRPFPPTSLPDELKRCIEQVGSVTLDAGPGSVGANGLTGVTYQWTSGPGDPALNTSTSQTTVITYPMIKDQEDEQILAFVTITNQFNTVSCPVTDTILVRDVCVPRVFPPTVFHPGDGNPIDAEFTIKAKYLSKFKITVYNRWGEVIFYSEDINKNWDGTYRGELMPVGVYAYIITYEGTDEMTQGPYKKEGRIVLVR